MTKTTYTHITASGNVAQRKSVNGITYVTVVVVDGEHRVATWHATAEAAHKIVNGNSKTARALQHKGVYVEAINGGQR